MTKPEPHQVFGYSFTSQRLSPKSPEGDDPDTQYSFNVNDAGVKSGDVVAYDLAQGKFAQYAVNVRKALAVPAIARKRVEGWRYQEWDADLAMKIASALVICGVSNPDN